MRVYTKKREYRAVKVLEKITCDWCKKDFKTEGEFNDQSDSYDVEDFKLTWRIGSNYPEGGSGELCLVELCFECRAKLKELLIANGITIQEEGWDW